ncbi:MAG: hypothetical protein A3I86_00105 [Candidatus Zambryskibacteria bacterium RIFCSPLOWO2_02_FULL_39_14]|uniref:Reverse transcriptase domain-containing protein n=1 Tax=Candidatus Zambryskibacteria bacterium RIFCSPLOWO2_02_FULL_39_14 TaxID=1802769 RepID=A0A1G2UF73_9BACT|nr:MAG: hypothetical protein A3I86_00105 [Candidatus Zambryskibacteria bacterium RIFCSPLOWO2_02_FULL_39_14]
MNFYIKIISLENLFTAWEEFIKGKRKRKDIAEFSEDLSSNVYSLHLDLLNKTYWHDGYHAFNISDPKPRNIHKATVRDRLLHHAVYRVLYPYFDKKFIHDSYSCRLNKGTHRAMERFKSAKSGKGLPLGNLTSQLLVNIYMNEFDQYIKHNLKVKYYIRYADDFVITMIYRSELENLLPELRNFLKERLKLSLHPDKVFIKTLASGIDFLGWVHFPDHRVLRTTTKRRMVKNLSKNYSQETIALYHGLLKHGNTYKLREKIRNLY